jgi:drug/metabolite transporter (DMT)-like permease
MAAPQPKSYLDSKAVTILLILCLLWGVNMVAIKFSNRGLAPIFTAGMRSLGASVLMLAWMIYRKQPLVPKGLKLIHPLTVGVLFGLEFVFIYVAQQYTLASRSSIFLFSSPFWVALGAHFLIPGNRLTWSVAGGLMLAFIGLLSIFFEGLFSYSRSILFGDFLMLLAALSWAATTIYIKRFLVWKCTPFQTLLYQILFSVPIMLLLSLIMEKTPIRHIDGLILLSFFYQTFIVAFLSYWAWFYLIHIYPVTRLAAFSFITPLSGVFMSHLILGEPLSLGLILALVLVSVGIYWVNKGK